MDHLLSFLSECLPQANTIEQLARPLLVLLSKVTGMESTYLTTIDLERGVQRVEYARNMGEMTIPEGLVVPWEDTLCKRALEENRMYSDDVAECWGDSDAARALGIKTYLSAPLKAQDGSVLGTVCAASAAQVPRGAEVEPILRLISGLLSFSLEREILLQRLQSVSSELATFALTDALTGLYNRRAIPGQLSRMMALARREGKYLLIGIVDLDDFKKINDTHGHQAGDIFLQAVSANLQGSLRASDVLGRLGGDEFIVVALGPLQDQPDDSIDERQHAAQFLQEKLTAATVGAYALTGGGADYRYAGASVGVVAVLPGDVDADDAIKLADHAMYQVKQQRKAAAPRS